MYQSWLSLFILLLVTVPGICQSGKAVRLEWKFREGEKFWVDTQTKIEQSEKFNTQVAANIVHMRTITSYLVKKVTENNSIELEAKIESMQYRNNQTPDSEKMSTLYSRLQGATFRLILGADLQVQKLEGYNEWLLKLSNVIPVSEVDRIRALMPEADLRNAISEGFGFLPDKDVTLNQTWKKKTDLNLAPAGTLTTNLTYTYRGTDKGKEKITIDCKEQGKFTMSPGLATPGTQSEFVMDNRTGTILFNNQTGKMEQAEHQYQTRGTILLPASVNSAPATMLVINKIHVWQSVSPKPPSK